MSIFKPKKGEIQRDFSLESDYYKKIKRFPKTEYIKKQPTTSSRRLNTFEPKDSLIYDMDVADRIKLYQIMYQECGWIQRGAAAIVADCLNTHPLIDVLFDEEKFNSDKVYMKKVYDLKESMEKPCLEMNRRAFFQLTYLQLFIYGMAYWQKLWNVTKNRILGYVLLKPESMIKIQRIDKNSGLKTFYYLQKYRKREEKGTIYQDYKLFTEDDIVHFVEPNILNPLYGKSRLDGLLYVSYLDTQTLKFQSKFFKHGITPGMIINIEDISEDVLDHLNDVLSQRYRNTKEPYSPMIIPGRNVKLLNDKDNLSDLDLRDLRRASAHEILHILGIPPLLLSLDKLQIQRQDTSYDNYIQHTVAPLQHIFCDTINNQIILRHYDESSIWINTGSQVVPGTKDAAEFCKTVMQLVPMTANEIRELTGITLLEQGGEEFYIYTPNGVVPYDYHFNNIGLLDQEKTYVPDENGKPIDPKKMFTHEEMKLGQRIKRDMDEDYRNLFKKIIEYNKCVNPIKQDMYVKPIKRSTKQTVFREKHQIFFEEKMKQQVKPVSRETGNTNTLAESYQRLKEEIDKLNPVSKKIQL